MENAPVNEQVNASNSGDGILESDPIAVLAGIDSAPGKQARRSWLRALSEEWHERGRYYEFLKAALDAPEIPEDGKLRLLTMGRPGPEDVRAFVANHSVWAAEMILAIVDSPAPAVNREQRLDSLGFCAPDVVACLMREPRQVRDPLIASIRARTLLPVVRGTC